MKCMDWHLWRVYAASTVSLSVHAEPGGKHKIKAKYKTRVQFSMEKKKTQSKTHPQDSSFCAAFIAIPFPSAHPFIQVSWTNTQLIINTVHHGQALLELWPPPLIMPVMSTPLISLVFDIPIDLPDVGHSESHAGCDRSWMPLRMLETSHLLYLIIHTDMIAGLIDAHAFGKKKSAVFTPWKIHAAVLEEPDIGWLELWQTGHLGQFCMDHVSISEFALCTRKLTSH